MRKSPQGGKVRMVVVLKASENKYCTPGRDIIRNKIYITVPVKNSVKRWRFDINGNMYYLLHTVHSTVSSVQTIAEKVET